MSKKQLTFWQAFKKAGREMYQIPEGVSATRFIASLPAGYLKDARGRAVSEAYSARRTKGLQAVMNYQHMRGDGSVAPSDVMRAREAAHQALEDFPEMRAWIDPNAVY
jgi:hypothetical protein